MKPTHALFVVDNSQSDEDKYWIFAYEKDGVFYSSETNRPIIEFVGDEVLKQVKLP